MAFHNLAGEYSTTTGTSDAVLSGAVPGFNTWENAGVTNGETVKYRMTTFSLTTNRPTHSETGKGTYTTATNTLARTTVESSTNGGSKIVLTGLSEVYIVGSALDANSGYNPFASYYHNGTADTITNNTDNNTLSIDTEWVDAHGVATLATNTVTINEPGWYIVSGLVQFTGGAAFNGYVDVYGTLIQHRRGIYVTANAILEDNLEIFPTLFQVTTTQAINAKIDNHSGQSLSAYVVELTARKLGNL